MTRVTGITVTATKGLSAAEEDAVVRTCTSSQRIFMYGYTFSCSSNTNVTIKFGSTIVMKYFVRTSDYITATIPEAAPISGKAGESLNITSTDGDIFFSANLVIADVLALDKRVY